MYIRENWLKQINFYFFTVEKIEHEWQEMWTNLVFNHFEWAIFLRNWANFLQNWKIIPNFLKQKNSIFYNWFLKHNIIVTSFDTRLMPAIRKMFYVKSHKDLVHYTQCIFRKFQELGFFALRLIVCRLFNLFLPVNKLIAWYQDCMLLIS